MRPFLQRGVCVHPSRCLIPDEILHRSASLRVFWGSHTDTRRHVWFHVNYVRKFPLYHVYRCKNVGKNLQFVVIDLYVPWLVSSASINDCLNYNI